MTDYRPFGRTGVKVTPADFKQIDAIVPPGTHVAPFYEANFSPSVYRW